MSQIFTKIEDEARERVLGRNFTALLKSLPFMHETSLEAKINELLFRFESDLRVYFTSGTTKKPKALYSNSSDIRNTADYIQWFCEVEGIAGGETVAVLMDHSFWAVGPLTCLGHIAAGNSVIPIDLRSKEAITEVLDAVAPTVISTLPSKLEEYADILSKRNFKVLETTGEPMNEKQRARLEKIYNAEIFDAYGLTEGVVGVECKNHNGYHYREDKVYLEIKSLKSDNIVPDGRFGEIVMTNLMCHAQPIIRYCTGDAGKILRDQCSCGLRNPRLILRGRVGKTHYLLDGVKIRQKNMQEILQEVLGHVPQYKIKVSVKEGIAYIYLDVDQISASQSRKIIEKVSETNYDVFNLVRTNQLKFIIRTQNI
ncbi:MAG: phenylacetate--CoA ligase family protein [Candidatus Andersenbacteria bacterium]|nr:phenylacetate--CoA ligase family protein [Candidatus Andersenbacteria bacterium]